MQVSVHVYACMCVCVHACVCTCLYMCECLRDSIFVCAVCVCVSVCEGERKRDRQRKDQCLRLSTCSLFVFSDNPNRKPQPPDGVKGAEPGRQPHHLCGQPDRY